MFKFLVLYREALYPHEGSNDYDNVVSLVPCKDKVEVNKFVELCRGGLSGVRATKSVFVDASKLPADRLSQCGEVMRELASVKTREVRRDLYSTTDNRTGKFNPHIFSVIGISGPVQWPQNA